MMATLQEDYITMAKSKGLPTCHILLGHALRPSSFSLLTLAGVNIGRLIGGAVIVELLFGIPGIGLMLVQSIHTSDLFMLQGALLFIVVAYVVINLLIDLLYADSIRRSAVSVPSPPLAARRRSSRAPGRAASRCSAWSSTTPPRTT